jgi:NAD dependent epimerase/dehydratase family enzyme
MSWVHLEDTTGFIMYALEKEKVSGIFNMTAPNPVTNKEFSTALGKALNRPSLFPVPGGILKAALGEFGQVLLTGQRCLPERVLTAGYSFKYPLLDEALTSILK